MAPFKSPPVSRKMKNQSLGITFSLNLTSPKKKIHNETESDLSMPPPSPTNHSYTLKTNIITVTSLSLLRRLNRISPSNKQRRYSSSSTDDIAPVKEKSTPGRKRKLTHVASTSGECIWCNTKKTAQWRKGPKGPRSLCNACGLEWAKQIRIEAKRLSSNNQVAEESLIANYKESKEFKKSQQTSEKETSSPAEDLECD